MKYVQTFLASFVLFSIAPIAHAQAFNAQPLSSYLMAIIGFIDSYVVPLVFALAFIVFIWGMFQYFILGGANEEKREQGKQLFIWGIIGFFVMISLWGIVRLFTTSFGFGGQNRPDLPRFQATQPTPPPSN